MLKEINKPILFNFFGAPSSGKSGASTELFTYFKRNHLKCEFIPEVAKDVFYEGSNTREDQLLLMAMQNNRIHRAMKYNQFLVCDSPILLSGYYVNRSQYRNDNEWKETFNKLMLHTHRRYYNINFWLDYNPKTFEQDGARYQTDSNEGYTISKGIWDYLQSCEFIEPLWRIDIENLSGTMIPYVEELLRERK